MLGMLGIGRYCKVRQVWRHLHQGWFSAHASFVRQDSLYQALLILASLPRNSPKLGSAVTIPLETDFAECDFDNGRKLKSGGTHEAPGFLVQGVLLDGRNRRLGGNSNQ